MNIIQAIKSLYPTAEFSVQNNAYAGLEWFSAEIIAPTEAEITAEIARLQADYEAKLFQRQRAAAYPSITDQLDLLYHGGMDAWKAAITAVKEEFPKEQI